MSSRIVIKYIILTFSTLIVLSLVAGSILGQPVLLSYVETGSMSPTLEPGDGFIAIPAQLAGPIHEGDVVVYEAEEVQGGGLTTHRIVKETERGYITRGDANPFADQDGGEPPVKDAQVVAVAWEIDGSVLKVPHLGTVSQGIQSSLSAVQKFLARHLGTAMVLGTQGLAYLFFAAALLWYILGEWRGRNTRDRQQIRTRKDGINIHLVVGTFTLLLVVGVTFPMAVPTGTQQYGIVSADFDSERPEVIPTGQSKSLQQPLANDGRLPVVVYLESASDGVEVQPNQTRLAGGNQVNATITIHAPEQTGYYRRFVTHRRYLAILPRPALDTLYQFHPWAPIIVIDALIGVPFYIFGITLLGTGRVRNRSRSRDLSVRARLRQILRGLY